MRIVEPFFVDFGKSLEHSPDGKAYLLAHGATAPANGEDRFGSHWHVGDQGYFVNIPSKFIAEDGRTAWLRYAADFSAHTTPTLRQMPPGSRYAMNLHEIRLGGD